MSAPKRKDGVFSHPECIKISKNSERRDKIKLGTPVDYLAIIKNVEKVIATAPYSIYED